MSTVNSDTITLFYCKTLTDNGMTDYVLSGYNVIPAYFHTKKIGTIGTPIWDFFKLGTWGTEKIRQQLASGCKNIPVGDISFESQKYHCELICMPNENLTLQLSKLEPFSLSDLVYFKLMVENSIEAMALLENRNGTFFYLYNNAQHQKITGFSAVESSEKNICDILGDPYYKKYETNCRHCIKTNSPILFKGLANWNGTVKERLCRLVPIFYKNKEYIMAIEIETDSLKNWMRENQLALTKFDNMFHDHASIMLLIEPETGKIIDANPSAITFYGYSLQELTSLSIQDINTLSNEEVKKQRNRAAIKNKQYFLFPHRLKNGEIKFVDVYSSPIEINDRQYLFSIITDVTKREQNEIELYKEKELQRITMDSIADCVVTTDEQGRITYLNNAAAIAAEWKQAEVIGKYFNEIFPMTNEYTQDTVPNIVEAVLKTSHKQELANHTMLHTKSGNKIPIEDSAAPILDKNGKRYGAVVIFRDVTAAKEKKKKIKYLSYHDALTGLYNRNFYYDYIDHSNNTGIYPLGYIIGDVNGLKMTNDVFGHTMGDNLLKTVSDILQKTADTNDRVIRWGGDEFIIVVPHADRKHLESLIVKIKSDLKSITITDGIEASVSFGMSIKQHKWISTDDILKEAEEMMYQTKLLESKSMRGNTINALMTTLDEKSEETKAHTLRLSDICLKIAEQLEQHTEIKNRLALLAVLHDIGKVGIPDHILGKPEALTEDEWQIMKTHPEIGYRIASNVPELHAVANEILHHHEKWDGTGYPSGLKGEKIPINCRILSVVDSYDAMTNDRVYRKARTHEQAMDELRRFAGIQFDPIIVAAFAAIY